MVMKNAVHDNFVRFLKYLFHRYIGWSNCHDAVAKVLRKYYSKPYFLPKSAENNAVDWIFMGGPGDGAQMHVNIIFSCQ